ncbi:shkA [Acrasis kona]|uniref:ShkA n=1 Tax=Acrasis kona TaxID=1008807 RepID=A0AAW2Z6S2_9EUKA
MCASIALSYILSLYSFYDVVFLNISEGFFIYQISNATQVELYRNLLMVVSGLFYLLLTLLTKLSLSYNYHEYVARNPELQTEEPLLDSESVTTRDMFMYDIRHWIVEAQEIEFHSKISEGSFGVVFRGKYVDSKVAIKMIKRQESEVEFEHEVRMLIMLRHPNIVLFMGACVSDKYKMDKSLDSLIFSKIEDNKTGVYHQRLPFTTKLSILKDVSSALAFMNGRNNPICHRDLKPNNILLNKEITTAKICDLGSSRNLSNQMMTFVGTPNYMSPEVVCGGTYTEKCDVYSFAIIMFELFFESKAYQSLDLDNDFVKCSKITHGERPWIPEGFIIENASERERIYLELMVVCWSQESELRPSFSQVSLNDTYHKPDNW